MKLLGSSQLLPNLYLQQPTTTTLRDGSFVCCQVVDVDRLFTNMETVCEVSAALLHRLHEAIAEPDKEAVVIGNRRSPFDLDRPNPLPRCASDTSFPSAGEVFIQAKAALEDVYKIYCYHHDDANTSLKSYEKEDEIKQHFTTCVSTLK